jgi:hypothetical protein
MSVCVCISEQIWYFTDHMLPSKQLCIERTHAWELLSAQLTHNCADRWSPRLTRSINLVSTVVHSRLKTVSIVSSDIRFRWSQWPRRLRRRSAAARLLRLWVWIQPVTWMSLCCECCVFSGKGLCVGLITGPEESYGLWCVVVCELKTSWMRRAWPNGGCRAKTKKNLRFSLPSDLLPSRFTTIVVVDVYLSSLPSRFSSNRYTDLQFLVTLCNETQNKTKYNSTVRDTISSKNNCNFTLKDTCRKPRDVVGCSTSVLHVSGPFFLKTQDTQW